MAITEAELRYRKLAAQDDPSVRGMSPLKVMAGDMETPLSENTLPGVPEILEFYGDRVCGVTIVNEIDGPRRTVETRIELAAPRG